MNPKAVAVLLLQMVGGIVVFIVTLAFTKSIGISLIAGAAAFFLILLMGSAVINPNRNDKS